MPRIPPAAAIFPLLLLAAACGKGGDGARGADAKGAARGEEAFRGHWGGSPERAARTGHLRGTVAEARAMVDEFRALGCTRLCIAFREGPYDWEALEAFASEIVRPS